MLSIVLADHDLAGRQAHGAGTRRRRTKTARHALAIWNACQSR
ncbi:hypothetical protein [Sulfuriferula sp. AH1]|nr:hypothetical protein [Sulfuriferula sp. AH1]